MKIDSCL